MKRNNPAGELRRRMIEYGAKANSAAIEIGEVTSTSPTKLLVGGASIELDIKKLLGAAYSVGDMVAVELVDGDYLILGKVVDAT